MMKSSAIIFCAIAGFVFSDPAIAKNPDTLFGRLAPWQYPGAEFRGGAAMSDAATVDKNGKRTVPSIQCTTVLVTDDPIEKVLEFYKSKLEPRKNEDNSQDLEATVEGSGRSVTFHEDSTDRPVKVHMIMVNSSSTSTTLVISRAEGESQTHIAWAQYSRF